MSLFVKIIRKFKCSKRDNPVNYTKNVDILYFITTGQSKKLFREPTAIAVGQKTNHSEGGIRSEEPITEEALFFAVSVQKCEPLTEEALFFVASVQK